ncbi:MAG TPA: ALF repeat-containing protein, partial [Candidatus Limnocylindrales bacterium]
PAAAAEPAPIGLDQACQAGARPVYFDIRTIVNIDVDTAPTDQVFALVSQVLAHSPAVGYNLVKQAANEILDGGSVAEARQFLKVEMLTALGIDLRILVNQTLTGSGTNVRDAAQAALDLETIDGYLAYLNTGQHVAREKDYKALVEGAKSTGGPEVRKAAAAALQGTFEDLRWFLCAGWKTAHSLDLAAAQQSPSASPSPSAVQTTSTAELPRTGPDTTTVLLAGLVLIAGGVGALAIARRRRA